MTATSNLKLSKTTEKRVSELTLKLKTNWKKTTAAVLETGKCLHELKQLLPRKDFIAHVKKEIGISEKHAMRLIRAHSVFGNRKTAIVLSTKPTILYEVARVIDEAQIDSLSRGRRVKIGGGSRSLGQIKTRDLHRRPNYSQDLERKIVTCLEVFQDEIVQLQRLVRRHRLINNKIAVRASIQESVACLKNLAANI